MQFTWTAKDAEPGRIVHRLPEKTNPSFEEVGRMSDMIYIIGYGYAGDHKQFYCLTSFADGMQACRSNSREELAEALTKDNYQPMTGCDKDQVIRAAAAVALRIR